jgi:hypothetical protein
MWTMSEWSKTNWLEKKKKTLSSLMPSSAKSQLRGGKRNSGVIYDLDAWINYSEKLTNREKCEKKIDRRGLHEFDACYVKRKIKLLTMGIAHDFRMGEIIKCRKT